MVCIHTHTLYKEDGKGSRQATINSCTSNYMITSIQSLRHEDATSCTEQQTHMTLVSQSAQTTATKTATRSCTHTCIQNACTTAGHIKLDRRREGKRGHSREVQVNIHDCAIHSTPHRGGRTLGSYRKSGRQHGAVTMVLQAAASNKVTASDKKPTC